MNPNIYIPDIWAIDYILAFTYIIIISLFFYAYQNKKADLDPAYKYYMKAFYIKIAGGLGFMVLTVYYWGGGDTYSYYNTGRDMLSYILEEPLKRYEILFTGAKNMNWYEYAFAYNRHQFLNSSANFTTVKITALINLISFQSYVVSTVIFSVLSFLGVWSTYFVFCKIYPHLRKQLFYGFFFIPSVILWGSGILKDTITLSSIGFIIYSFVNLVILKRKKGLSFFLIITATLTIAFIKPYILYILYPCLFIWVQSNLKSIIRSSFLRKFIAPVIAVVLITSSYFLTDQLSQSAGKYNLDQIENTLGGFRNWQTTVCWVKHQSGYSLGDMDFTTIGILKKVPASIEVTFFRPYLWEVYNPSTLLGAMEGTVLLVFVLYLVLKYRMSLFRLIIRNKNISFLVLFSLLFGVSVGISSYNFGALSRYKIPAQMFFVVALILIQDSRKAMDEEILKKKR